MEKKRTILEELKGTHPFLVPDGYLEGLAGQVTSHLPEKPRREARRVSLYDRVRPWLYLAAVFAGLVFLFRTLVRPQGEEDEIRDEPPFYVQTTPGATGTAFPEEDGEYLEYLELGFYNNVLSEVMENME
jgi:hypothetical protein